MFVQTTPETTSFNWHSAEPKYPNPAARIVFAVPAKDEEDSIADCIAALENQLDATGERLPWSDYEVVILVNNTTDATIGRALAAKSHPGIHIVSVDLPPHRAHIGWARRLAMEWCSQRLQQNGHAGGIIVSTDADSQIAPDFVEKLKSTFASPAVDAAGASLAVQEEIGGEVLRNLARYFKLEKELRLKAQQETEFDLMHSHFSGAGFAVRQNVYEAVGGLTPLPYNEDKQFYYKLLQRDARIRMNERLVVRTSGRTTGRTEWGMAAQFRQWQKADASGETVFVSSARSQWLFFQFQRVLHAHWAAQDAESEEAVIHCLLAYQMPAPARFLARIDFPPYFGQYWCRVWEHPKMVEARQRAFPAVTVSDSIAEFSTMLLEPDGKTTLLRA